MAYIDSSIYTFQNSMKGLIQMSYSPNGCGLQFTPVFRPISPKDIQPGMKIYDYQNSKWFTLDVGEALGLAHILEEVLTIMRLVKLGQYNGPVVPNHLAQKGPVTVDANRQQISITHYPKDGMSVVSLVADSKNSFVWYFNYNFIQNKQSVFSISLAIREHEIYLLKEYLKGVVNYKAAYAANYRLQYDQSKDDAKGNKNNNNARGGSNNYNNASNSNSNYNNSGSNNYSNNYNNNQGNYNNNYNNSNNNAPASNSNANSAPAEGNNLAGLIS